MWEKMVTEKNQTAVTLEKQYIKSFWKMYRIEMSVNFWLFTTLFYTSTSLIIGKFSTTILRGLLVPSMATALAGIYLRRVQMSELQN